MKHRLNTDKKRQEDAGFFHPCSIRVSSVAKGFFPVLLSLWLAACTPPQKSASKSDPAIVLKGVTAIAVFPTELPLIAGAAPHRVAVTATDKDGFELPAPAKFTSDNPTVATVSADGKIRPLTPGTATITAKFSGKAASAKVTVRRAGDFQSPSAASDCSKRLLAGHPQHGGCKPPARPSRSPSFFPCRSLPPTPRR